VKASGPQRLRRIPVSLGCGGELGGEPVAAVPRSARGGGSERAGAGVACGGELGWPGTAPPDWVALAPDDAEFGLVLGTGSLEPPEPTLPE
jgi:hypothetical protein